MSADLILRNGRFTTLNPSLPSATAVAITDGRFTTVGRGARSCHWAGRTLVSWI